LLGQPPVLGRDSIVAAQLSSASRAGTYSGGDYGAAAGEAGGKVDVVCEKALNTYDGHLAGGRVSILPANLRRPAKFACTRVLSRPFPDKNSCRLFCMTLINKPFCFWHCLGAHQDTSACRMVCGQAGLYFILQKLKDGCLTKHGLQSIHHAISGGDYFYHHATEQQGRAAILTCDLE
jgi:hypothetical protein